MKFTEAELEKAIAELLAAEGHAHLPGPGLQRQEESQVLISQDLKAFLRQQYQAQGITENEVEQVVRQLQNLSTADLYESNKAFMRLLADGFALKREDRSQKDLYIYLLDYSPLSTDKAASTSHNIHRFVNQLKIQGTEERIPDGILYINGLPLVVFEFKSAIREEANIHKAYKQLTTRYRRDIPQLFVYNAFCIISDGVNNKAGSFFAPYEFFYAWRKTNGSGPSDSGLSGAQSPTIDGGLSEIESPTIDGGLSGAEGQSKEALTLSGAEAQGINSLYTLVQGMLHPHTLLDILQNFIYLPDSSKKEEKILCRYPQYYAARKLFDNIKQHQRPRGNGKGGTYFGATGCGKSFTMLFLTRLLMKSAHFSSPTVVLITDRTDLDKQLSDQFTGAKAYVGDQIIKSVSSRQNLREQLQGRNSGGVFLSTIHKFTEDTRLLSQRSNIICISDEAHRSQTNLDLKVRRSEKGVSKTYGFAKHLHSSLPNATYVGFTGTPVDATLSVFGQVVEAYTMAQSVNDQITVPIVYEGRAAKILANSSKLREIEDYYAQCAEEGSSEYQIESSQKAVASMSTILGDPDRIKTIAADFVAHYENRIAEGATVKGKALLVSSKREIAFQLYQEIIALRPQWNKKLLSEEGAQLSEEEQKKLQATERVKMVMTRHKEDPKALYDLLGSQSHREDLDKQFKLEKSNFKIAIVVDMWLTGFDVPFLDTIYIDKPVQRHSLIQTISRVNRTYPGKTKGLVVDYIGIKKQMNLALAQYSAADGQNFEDIAQSVVVVKNHLDLLHQFFHKFNSRKYYWGTALQQLETLNQAAEYVQHTLATERRFMGLAKRLKAAYNICSGHEDISDGERDQVHFYLAVRSIIFKLSKGEAPDTAQMNARVRDMVQEALESEGIEEVFKLSDSKEVDLFSPDYLAKIDKIKLPHTKIKLLQKLLNQAIDSFKKVNKVKGIDFAERMKALVEKYNERKEGDVLRSEVLEDFTNEIINLYQSLLSEKASHVDIGIDFEEKAFFDILKALTVKYDFEYPENKLVHLAREVKQVVDDKAKYVDWNKRDDIKAALKADLIVLLAENDYPPIDRDEVYQEIFEQAENFKKHQPHPHKKLRYFGYLYLGTEDYLQAEEAFFTYKAFAQSMGFGFIQDGEFVKGSWIRRNIQMLLRVFQSKEAREIFDKGKKAIELAHLEKTQSEVNKNNAEAAASFIKAIESIPNVASIFGSLVVVKATIDGTTQLITRVLSSNELIALEKQPELINNPLLLMERLNGNGLLE